MTHIDTVQQHQPLQQQPTLVTHRYSSATPTLQSNTTPTTAATTYSLHTQTQSNNTNPCSNNLLQSHTDTVQQHQPPQQQTTPTTAATTYSCHAHSPTTPTVAVMPTHRSSPTTPACSGHTVQHQPLQQHQPRSCSRQTERLSHDRDINM